MQDGPEQRLRHDGSNTTPQLADGVRCMMTVMTMSHACSGESRAHLLALLGPLRIQRLQGVRKVQKLHTRVRQAKHTTVCSNGGWT